MGYIRHNAIVVTSWDETLIEATACRARNIGLTVIGPSAKATNGYRTLLVCPDGSKEGWEESDQGDERRATFRDWMSRDTKTAALACIGLKLPTEATMPTPRWRIILG